MKYSVISDMHLGDGTKKEDFHKDKELMELLMKVNANHKLVINGDGFELWQCKLQDILDVHREVISRLMKVRNNVILIAGNHDRLLLKENMLDMPVYRQYHIKDTLFIHGHQFDFSGKMIRVLGKIEELMELYVDPDFDGRMEGLYNRLARRGRFGQYTTYRVKALEMIEQTSFDRIILGHTHHAEKYAKDGKQYINTGTWTGKRKDVLEIEI